MSHRPKITEEQEQKILTMYAQGRTQKAIAASLGLSVPGVQNVVRRNAVPKRRPGRKASVDSAVLVAAYEAGRSLKEIGSDFGLHPSTVWDHLKRAGTLRRPAGFQRGEAHVGWGGGKTTNSSGYVMVRIYPEHPFFSMATEKVRGASYVLEHRLVMAQELGRVLTEDETVHHVDGNKLNNERGNLQLRRGRHGKGVALCCADCGSCNIVPTAIV